MHSSYAKFIKGGRSAFSKIPVALKSKYTLKL